MNREVALTRRVLVLLVAVSALAGCTVLGLSKLPADAPAPATIVEATETPIPPTATPTAPPVVLAVAPSPVPPTATPEPTDTATPVPPTETAVPTATRIPSTATAVPKAPTAKPAAATSTATEPPDTATKQPTPNATATATKVPAPSGSKAVGLDPGHHILDQGGDSTLIGIPEYKLTMETALAVKSILVGKGYTVRLSRTTVNPVSCWCSSNYNTKVQVEQEARIRAVGVVGAYVPIHFNASPTNHDSSAGNDLKGTTSYYNVDQAVASQSKTLAQSLVSNVVARVRAAGYATVNRGAQSDLLVGKSYGHYFGLRGPYPSSLLESLFMDQKDDAAALRRPEIRAAIAQGIADGIIAFLH